MSRRKQVLDALQLTDWHLRQPATGMSAGETEVVLLS